LNLDTLTKAQITQLQALRAIVYSKVQKRWDLIHALDVAEVYANAHEMPLERALVYLERSILRGEFGAHPRRRIFWLPSPPRIDWYPHPIKIRDEHIAGMRVHSRPLIDELWLPRAQAAAWLRDNDVTHIPSWLRTVAVIGGKLEVVGEVVDVGATTAATPVLPPTEHSKITKVQLSPDQVHPLVRSLIEQAPPKTINRANVWQSIQKSHPEVRQEDVYAAFQDPRYDELVRRRKGPD
jgi:hypothetical protein